MEKKNITMYVLLGLIGFIVIIGTVNSFRTSRSLVNAKASIDSAIVHIDRSNTILKAQGLSIDSIKLTNKNLLDAINVIDANSKKIKESLIWRIDKDNAKTDSIIKALKNVKITGKLLDSI